MSIQSHGNHDKDGRLVQPQVYPDGRTKQAFKDETDINKILHRAQKTGTISHLAKHEASYSDFADFDFFTAQLQLTRGREIFDDLPSEIRNEFGQSQSAFFAYVNDPANKDDLLKKLPQLAAPGRQNLDVSGKSPPPALVASATAKQEPPKASEPVTATPAQEPPKAPDPPPAS